MLLIIHKSFQIYSNFVVFAFLSLVDSICFDSFWLAYLDSDKQMLGAHHIQESYVHQLQRILLEYLYNSITSRYI